MTLAPELIDGLCAGVDRRADEILGLLSELVAIPSHNPPGQEAAIAGYLASVLGRLGLGGAELMPVGEGRDNLVWRSSGGSGTTSLAMTGHLDTKPPGVLSEWLTDPWTPVIQGDRIVGLGTSDMKGALAAMVFAASIVEDLAPPRQHPYMLAFTADEEYSMDGARVLAPVLDAAAVVIGEPAGTRGEWERLYVGSRGLSALKVMAEGTQMHSSLSDLVPSVNASADLAWALRRMHDEFRIDVPPHPYSTQGVTVNVGVTLSGGIQYGVYPGHAEFGVDIRVPPNVSRATIRQALDDFLRGLRAERSEVALSWVLEAPPLDWMPATETSSDHALPRAASSAMRQVLGATPAFGVFPGGTEAVVYQGAFGIPCLPALGPGILGVSHAPNEYVRIPAVVQAAKVYALMIAEMTG